MDIDTLILQEMDTDLTTYRPKNKGSWVKSFRHKSTIDIERATIIIKELIQLAYTVQEMRTFLLNKSKIGISEDQINDILKDI